MTPKKTRDIDAVVYLARPIDGAETNDLRRILYKLRCDMSRKGGTLRIVRHVPGRFVEFAGCGLHGSFVVSNRPAPRDLGLSQANHPAPGMNGKALRRARSRHQAHVHLQLSAAPDCHFAETAGRRILQSIIGVLGPFDPLCAYWSPSDLLMDLHHVHSFTDLPDQVLDLDTGPRRLEKLETQRLEVEPDQSVTFDLSRAKDQPVVIPRRVTPMAEPEADQGRHTATCSGTYRPSQLQSMVLAKTQSPSWLPFDLNLGNVTRVAAGVAFGLLISGWVSATFSPDAAMADATAINRLVE